MVCHANIPLSLRKLFMRLPEGWEKVGFLLMSLMVEARGVRPEDLIGLEALLTPFHLSLWSKTNRILPDAYWLDLT